MTNKEKIVNQIYQAYGTDSGMLFGIRDRTVVETIVKLTIHRIIDIIIEKQAGNYDEGTPERNILETIKKEMQ